MESTCLLSRLPDQLHWWLYSEWLTSYEDVVHLDIAMCNRELRKQYLSIKKKIHQIRHVYSTYLAWSKTWKVSRNICVDIVQLDFQSPEEIGNIECETMKDVRELVLSLSNVDKDTFVDLQKLLLSCSSLEILDLNQGSSDPVPILWSDEVFTPMLPLKLLSIDNSFSFPSDIDHFFHLLHSFCPCLHTLFLLNIPLSLETVVLKCLPFLPQLTHLECAGLCNHISSKADDDAISSVKVLPSFKKLELRNIEIDAVYPFKFLRLLFSFSFATLEELTINDVLIHHQSVAVEKNFWEEIFLGCVMLKSLQYSGMFEETILTTISTRSQNIHSHNYNHNNRPSPSMESIDLHGYHTTLDAYQLPPACWEGLGCYGCPRLQSLRLAKYWKLFDKDVIMFSKSIANPAYLCVLQINDCENLTLLAYTTMLDIFPSLQNIQFAFDQSFHDYHARDYGELQVLSHLLRYAKCTSCLKHLSFRSVEYSIWEENLLLLEDFQGRYNVLAPLLDLLPNEVFKFPQLQSCKMYHLILSDDILWKIVRSSPRLLDFNYWGNCIRSKELILKDEEKLSHTREYLRCKTIDHFNRTFSYFLEEKQ